MKRNDLSPNEFAKGVTKEVWAVAVVEPPFKLIAIGFKNEPGGGDGILPVA